MGDLEEEVAEEANAIQPNFIPLQIIPVILSFSIQNYEMALRDFKWKDGIDKYAAGIDKKCFNVHSGFYNK